MKFFIVTPSYNQLDWLKLCVASVRDQVSDDALNVKNVETPKGSLNEGSTLTCNGLNGFNENGTLSVHHHIQDARSSDGTPEWLARHIAKQPSTENYQLTFASEADEGMYDAINKGWKLAPDDTDVIAHLNCDEQYLPGALRIITEFFSKHWKADVVLADLIVVDRTGGYICHRRSLKPYALISRFCCGGFTTTTFQRASVTKEKKVFFDTSWKNFGDKVWYNALHRAGCRFAVCNELVAVFADTGANLNWTEQGRAEKHRYEEEFLWGSGAGTTLLSRFLGLRRLMKEWVMQAPSEYSLYRDAAAAREAFQILNPTELWHKKWKKD